MAPLEEFQRAPSAKVTSRMEERFSKESMKTAILKQEAIFRQQVNELHRLYGVQKQLMSNIAKNAPQNLEPISSCQPHYAPAAERLNEQESDLELTLATGCRRTARREQYTSYKSDSATSFSSSSSDQSGGSKLTGCDRGLLRVPELQSTICFDLEDEKRKGRMQPPWMLPCLSLRMSR